MSIDGKPVKMEVDTGAVLSVMSEKTYKHLRELLESPNTLRSYRGHELKVLGGLNTDVLYSNQLSIHSNNRGR